MHGFELPTAATFSKTLSRKGWSEYLSHRTCACFAAHQSVSLTSTHLLFERLKFFSRLVLSKGEPHLFLDFLFGCSKIWSVKWTHLGLQLIPLLGFHEFCVCNLILQLILPSHLGYTSFPRMCEPIGLHFLP